MEKTVNAKIKYSYLGFDEDKILVIELGFDCELGSVRTEKIELGETVLIEDILDTLELQRWEDLPRKFARVKVNETNRVVAVGNLIEEKWVKLSYIRD